jgi:hypothetical protein
VVSARTHPNPQELVHASIWKFAGDPDDLLRRYDAMLAEIPAASMRLHLCLRANDGIIIVDTCPNRETYEAFAAGPFSALRQRHGLPDPVALEDHPVHRAITDGHATS